MPENATGRAQGPAQKLIHDHDDGDRHQSSADGGVGPGFTTWLRTQAHRSGSVGSLATDMRGDGGWPELGTLAEYRAYLEQFYAPYYVLEALDVAWFEWITGEVV
jgi:hypothetical protein